MGKIKSNHQEETYKLTEKEFNLVKILNIALNYSVLKDRAISGFLYYICNSRLGYKDNDNLVFEIDLDKEDGELKIKRLSDKEIEEAKKNLK